MLIEWGERFPQLLPEDRIEIRLETLNTETAKSKSQRRKRFDQALRILACRLIDQCLDVRGEFEFRQQSAGQ